MSQQTSAAVEPKPREDREIVPVMLRMPRRTYERVKAAAAGEIRSANSYIVYLVERSLAAGEVQGQGKEATP